MEMGIILFYYERLANNQVHSLRWEKYWLSRRDKKNLKSRDAKINLLLKQDDSSCQDVRAPRFQSPSRGIWIGHLIMFIDSTISLSSTQLFALVGLSLLPYFSVTSPWKRSGGFKMHVPVIPICLYSYNSLSVPNAYFCQEWRDSDCSSCFKLRVFRSC